MDYTQLGSTGLEVSRMCFGVLTVGPLQANLSVDEGAKVIRYALERGVNFMDTAQYYQTYPYIRRAVKGYNGEVYVSSKSYAYTSEIMAESLEEARRELDRDVIDIFMLHEQESALTIKGHWEAYEYLLKCKELGIIKAAGISTHTVAGVKAAAAVPEIDVIHPLYNISGVGIVDGSAADMAAAITEAVRAGKGIYSMKPLGGGNLLRNTEEALAFVLGNNNLHSIALGMKTMAEVDMNVNLFEGKPVTAEIKEKVNAVPRVLHIESYCQGCGECVKRCSAGALTIVGGQAQIDMQACRLCGYCAPVCKEFCIKII